MSHKERGVSELEKMKDEFWDKWKSGAFSATVYIAPQNKTYPQKYEEEFKADLDNIIKQAVSHYCNKVKERYSEDVFPPDGNSLDCKSARMARLTCDNIIEEAKKEER